MSHHATSCYKPQGTPTDTQTHLRTLRGQDQFLETRCTPNLKLMYVACIHIASGLFIQIYYTYLIEFNSYQVYYL